jgi:hypothetical protein
MKEKIVMGKNEKEKTPKYVIKGQKAKAERVCTLSIRKVPVEQLEDEIAKLVELAISDRKKFSHIRGTLVCY